MAEDCPIDSENLSFSDEESSIFLTQSSFRDVSTQDLSDAIELFGEEINVNEQLVVEDQDLNNVVSIQEVDEEEMCAKVFDFSDEVDNGWSVSTQNDPHVVTRNRDGKQFLVGDSDHASDGMSSASQYEDLHVLPNMSKELEQGLKRFSTVVSAVESDESKRKQ